MIQVSAAHKVVGVPHDAGLANLFPNAKVVDFNEHRLMLLPHGFDETRVLRNMGHDVPAPILSQYDWPAGDGKKPFRVQQLTAALLTTNQRAYVLNGMGTGKTKSALWAYDYLRGLGLAHKALVLAPLSTLDHVWRKEAFRTLPHLKVSVLYGVNKAKRLKRLEEDADIYVINPDGLPVLIDELLKRTDIDTIIFDELALFRNASTDRNKLARKLAERMVWGWGMTGSPTPQEPTDVWGQCRILTPHTVPKFFTPFRDELMLKAGPFAFVPKKGATERAFQVMQPAVRFTLDDVTELPPVIERTVDVPLGKRQGHVYEELRKHAFAEVSNKKVSAVNAGAMLNKLLQVSLGYVYAGDGSVVALDNDVRIDALLDAFASTDRKVLCFVPYTHALKGVMAALTKAKIDCAMVDGSVSKKIRDYTFTAFQQTSKFKGIVAHPACMSHGLTLTAADTVIWFGPTPSLETFEQANARIRRIGQGHKQQIIMLQATPAEKKMYARLRTKMSMQDNLLEMFAQQTEEEH